MNITVEKLIEMVKAKVPNHVRDKWIHWMSSGVAIISTYGIPTNDKDFRDWVKKEVWLEHLLSRAKEIFLRTSEDFNIVIEIHRGDDLESWFRQFKLENRKMMFKNYEKEMILGSTMHDAFEIEKSATRVCHRYYKYLVKQNLLHQIPIQIKVWCKKDEHGMYSEKGNMDQPGGMSDYEEIHCPWWLDFPINSYPAEEKDEWHKHQKDVMKASDPIPLSKRLDVHGTKNDEKKRKKVKHKDVDVSDEETIEVGRVEHPCPQPFEIMCNVAIEIHCADVCHISEDLNRKIESKSFKELREFARSHTKPLARYMRAGKERDWGFDVLLMDFPTNDFLFADCSEIPDWNKCPQTLIEAAFALGNLCLDDGGWIVAICSSEQCKQVQRAGKLRNIEIMRTYTLVSDKPFGFKIDKLGTFAQLSLQVYVMGRIGTTPRIQGSASTDYAKSIIHHHHLQATKSLASPERQCTEKSIQFMEYLLEMLCPEGGVVLDLFAGTGSMLMACAIRGCHCFSFDSDPVLCDLVKAKCISKFMKPNALISENKNEKYDSESEDDDVVGQDVEEPEE